MPRLWDDTIDAHRRAVRDATLDTAAALVAEHGLRAVTMSRIAEETGIGRATLYKYFPDVESILLAWHERQVAAHLDQLERLSARTSDPGDRVRAVLEAYALIHFELASHREQGPEVISLLHRDEHVDAARHHVDAFVRDLLAEAAEAGAVRRDVAPSELATYSVQALSGASRLPSKAAVRRLVDVTLTGLRPTDSDTP